MSTDYIFLRSWPFWSRVHKKVSDENRHSPNGPIFDTRQTYVEELRMHLHPTADHQLQLRGSQVPEGVERGLQEAQHIRCRLVVQV